MFRKPHDLDLFEDKQWLNLRFAGDWIFYLAVIRGGCIAYTTKTTNYFRQHGVNTSTLIQNDEKYYREHEIVSKYLCQFYRIDDFVFERQLASLQTHYARTHKGALPKSLYDIKEIKQASSDRKPNIVMASFSFAAGGGETFPIVLANIMKSRGYAVTFFNLNRDKVELGVRKMLRSDIPVVSDLHKLNKIVHDFGAEIIHSHHAWVDSTILDGMSEEFTCRHIISCHGMYEDLDENRADELLPKMLEKCAKIVYTADKNLIPFKKRGLENHEKLTKIGNGLCLSDINPVDLSSYGISEDSFVLCLVSRAIPSKGWQEAIESVKIARATSKRDIQLIIIGDGEEYDRLKDIGLSYVHFLGFIPNIRDYYAASDMGYLPSRFRSESYPLTVIDCLFAGRPMLASNIGEISNMLHNGEKCSGVLFDLGSDWNIPVAKVAKLISRCANDQDYYNELLENVKHTTDKFGPDALYENYNKVYMSQI